ncbi:hypothetical protein ADUPG1_010037, partial [Aduncisulcus paluster]
MLSNFPYSGPIIFPSSSNEYILNIVSVATEYVENDPLDQLPSSLFQYSSQLHLFDEIVALDQPYVTTVRDMDLNLTEKLTVIEEPIESSTDVRICVDYRTDTNSSVSRVCFAGPSPYSTSISFMVEEDELEGMCVHIIVDGATSSPIFSVYVDRLGSISTQSTVDTSVSIYSFYSKIGTLYRETMANYTSSSLESSCLSAIPPVTSCSTDVPCIQTFDRVDGRFNHLTPGITYVEPETIPEFLAISVGYNTDYVSDFSSIFSSSAWKTVSTDGTTLPYLTLIPIPLGLSYRSSLSSTSSSYELKATSVSHSFSNDTDTFLFMGSSSTILSNNSVVMSVSVTATDPDRSSSTITKIYNPSNEILAIAVFSSDL